MRRQGLIVAAFSRNGDPMVIVGPNERPRPIRSEEALERLALSLGVVREDGADDHGAGESADRRGRADSGREDGEPRRVAAGATVPRAAEPATEPGHGTAGGAAIRHYHADYEASAERARLSGQQEHTPREPRPQATNVPQSPGSDRVQDTEGARTPVWNGGGTRALTDTTQRNAGDRDSVPSVRSSGCRRDQRESGELSGTQSSGDSCPNPRPERNVSQSHTQRDRHDTPRDARSHQETSRRQAIGWSLL